MSKLILTIQPKQITFNNTSTYSPYLTLSLNKQVLVTNTLWDLAKNCTFKDKFTCLAEYNQIIILQCWDYNQSQLIADSIIELENIPLNQAIYYTVKLSQEGQKIGEIIFMFEMAEKINLPLRNFEENNNREAFRQTLLREIEQINGPQIQHPNPKQMKKEGQKSTSISDKNNQYAQMNRKTSTAMTNPLGLLLDIKHKQRTTSFDEHPFMNHSGEAIHQLGQISAQQLIHQNSYHKAQQISRLHGNDIYQQQQQRIQASFTDDFHKNQYPGQHRSKLSNQPYQTSKPTPHQMSSQFQQIQSQSSKQVIYNQQQKQQLHNQSRLNTSPFQKNIYNKATKNSFLNHTQIPTMSGYNCNNYHNRQH